MPAEVFFDTTILVYTVTLNDSRAAIAEDLLALGGSISVQVLNEFVNVARKKLKMTWEETERTLTAFRALCSDPAPLTTDIHEAAVNIAKANKFHIYDALIIASALKAGCTTLYSEDMQHGQVIDTLTIRNPFLKQ